MIIYFVTLTYIFFYILFIIRCRIKLVFFIILNNNSKKEKIFITILNFIFKLV